jgi:hypothetical protein
MEQPQAQLAAPLDMYKLLADDKLEPYQSPISPKQFGRLSGNLLIVAFIIMSWFIM